MRQRGQERLTQINIQVQHWNQCQHQDRWSSTAGFPGTVHWLAASCSKKKQPLCHQMGIGRGPGFLWCTNNGAPPLFFLCSITFFPPLSTGWEGVLSFENYTQEEKIKKEGGVKTGEINEWRTERGKDGVSSRLQRGPRRSHVSWSPELCSSWALGRHEEQRTTLVLLQYASRQMESFFFLQLFFFSLFGKSCKKKWQLLLVHI